MRKVARNFFHDFYQYAVTDKAITNILADSKDNGMDGGKGRSG
jgi:hypothetical protein